MFEFPPIVSGQSLPAIAANCTCGAATASRRRRVVLAALPALAGLLSAVNAAAETTFADAGCVLTDGGSGIVAEIVDPVSVRLESGLVVRLAGIVPPPDPATTVAATALLADLTLGKEVYLRHGTLTHDRYQRAMAHLYLASEPVSWVQAELVAPGLAIVGGLAEDRACLADLIAVEREARDARLGLWQNDFPADAWSNRIREGELRFALVEGEVVSVGRTERTVYLNFGHDWSIDFTVTIESSDAAVIEAEGGSFDALIRTKVRIRGWLEQWDGPWIRVDHAEQIELLSEGNGSGVSH